MIKMIFKQLWNQRRQNGWILLELIVIAFFLFTTSAEVVRSTANYVLPDGYEKEMSYFIELKEGSKFRYARREREIRDSIFQSHFRQLLLTIKQSPEVEAVAIVRGDSYPGALSNNSNGFVSDDTACVRINCPWYQTFVIDGTTDFLKVYGLKDARTGGLLQLAKAKLACPQGIVSAAFARQLFGRTDVTGEKVHFGKKLPEGSNASNYFEIVGVYEGYKRSNFHVPGNNLFVLTSTIRGRNEFNHVIAYRLKEGVDGNAFRERIMNEIAPHYETTPTAIKDIKSFGESLKRFNDLAGAYSRCRYTAVMAFFVLLCVFLGMTGTFWVRCRARRQEIGLMRSIGASQATITRQFMTEAWMLVTIGFLIAQPLIIHYIHGLEWNVIDLTAHYWQDSKTWLTLATDALIYILMVLIALLGTWFPVKQASKDLPAEALRDE